MLLAEEEASLAAVCSSCFDGTATCLDTKSARLGTGGPLAKGRKLAVNGAVVKVAASLLLHTTTSLAAMSNSNLGLACTSLVATAARLSAGGPSSPLAQNTVYRAY